MIKLNYLIIGLFAVTIANSCSNAEPMKEETTHSKNDVVDQSSTQSDSNKTCETSSLGAFSVSLSVKDLQASKDFYEKLGFSRMGGDPSMNYLIMKNGHTIIGLFQGMFEGNILTFNPGWDENAQNINEFDDIRTIQKNLVKSGISIDQKIDTTASGPASLMITDPDGNLILLDQHR